MYRLKNFRLVSVTEFQSLRNFTNFCPSNGGKFCTVATMILRMRPGIFHSLRVTDIFFYKSISSLLLFYPTLIEIIIDLSDENVKLQDQKLVKFINLSRFKILIKGKQDRY